MNQLHAAYLHSKFLCKKKTIIPCGLFGKHSGLQAKKVKFLFFIFFHTFNPSEY